LGAVLCYQHGDSWDLPCLEDLLERCMFGGLQPRQTEHEGGLEVAIQLHACSEDIENTGKNLEGGLRRCLRLLLLVPYSSLCSLAAGTVFFMFSVTNTVWRCGNSTWRYRRMPITGIWRSHGEFLGRYAVSHVGVHLVACPAEEFFCMCFYRDTLCGATGLTPGGYICVLYNFLQYNSIR